MGCHFNKPMSTAPVTLKPDSMHQTAQYNSTVQTACTDVSHIDDTDCRVQTAQMAHVRLQTLHR